MTATPRTAAGRALLAALRDAGHVGDDWPWRIASIEAEATPSEGLDRNEARALLFLIASCVVPMAEKVSPDGGRRRAQLERAAIKIGALLDAEEG